MYWVLLVFMAAVHSSQAFTIPSLTTNNIHILRATNNSEDEFVPNKPIDLPSLNPQDAGPMYSTCRSVTGLEKQEEEEMEDFVPNKPIELDSLQQPTFFGLEPKSDSLRARDGSSVDDAGVPLFTGTIILGMSIYFIYLCLFGDVDMVDPSMPIAI